MEKGSTRLVLFESANVRRSELSACLKIVIKNYANCQTGEGPFFKWVTKSVTQYVWKLKYLNKNLI